MSESLDRKPNVQAIELNPIGYIQSDFKQKFATPRQGHLASHSRAELVLEPKWRGRGILSGLESLSHVWLITYLHLSETKRTRGKVHPPRLGGKKMGVLATRSPHRPNNIGLTLARIVSVEQDSLKLSEIDLVDGTPVLDIKPYVDSADRPSDYQSGWIGQVPPVEHPCRFSEQAELDLKKTKEPARLRALILEMLSQDPRPPAYKKSPTGEFAVWLGAYNILFNRSDETFVVSSITETEPKA